MAVALVAIRAGAPHRGQQQHRDQHPHRDDDPTEDQQRQRGDQRGKDLGAGQGGRGRGGHDEPGHRTRSRARPGVGAHTARRNAHIRPARPNA